MSQSTVGRLHRSQMCPCGRWRLFNCPTCSRESQQALGRAGNPCTCESCVPTPKGEGECGGCFHGYEKDLTYSQCDACGMLAAPRCDGAKHIGKPAVQRITKVYP